MDKTTKEARKKTSSLVHNQRTTTDPQHHVCFQREGVPGRSPRSRPRRQAPGPGIPAAAGKRGAVRRAAPWSRPSRWPSDSCLGTDTEGLTWRTHEPRTNANPGMSAFPVQTEHVSHARGELCGDVYNKKSPDDAPKAEGLKQPTGTSATGAVKRVEREVVNKESSASNY